MLRESFELEEIMSVSVTNVDVTYGSGRNVTRALINVSASFEAGKLTLVMGPSGSGKTTLLTLLGCILTPDKGVVELLGHNVSELQEPSRAILRRRHIGYVFQAFRLFRSLTAMDNVLLALDISGYRGRTARQMAEQALEDVGLGSKRTHKPDELSGGEKQRVAIARALVKDPSIILADEPTAALDSVSGENIAQTLFSLAIDQNRTVVVVSHDIRLIPYAHQRVTLYDGEISDAQQTL